MPPRPIFRQQALDRLSSPDRLDRLLPLTDLRGWLALAAAGLVLAGGLVWALVGTVATRVEGRAALARPGGTHRVTAPTHGVLTELHVKPGDDVAAGQLLARIRPTGGTPVSVPLVAPFRARVLDVFATPPDPVIPGPTILLLDPLDQPLQTILFLPVEDANRIRPGMDATVTEEGAPGGTWPGKVQLVGRFPASREALVQAVGSEAGADAMTRAGPAVRVVVVPVGEWPAAWGSGANCRVSVVVRKTSPARLALGWEQ